MAILRAGPFASSSDSFLDEPSSPDKNILPVNCALDDTSSDWPWRFFESGSDTSGAYKSGLPNLSASNSNSVASVFSDFYYQAYETFEITVTYAASLETTSSSNTFRAVAAINVDGAEEAADIEEGTGTGGISGTFNVFLPAAVVPIKVGIGARVDRFVIGGDTGAAETLSASISLSPA